MNKRDMLKQDMISAGERFADAFSLPKDMVVNATLFHMVGGSEIFVENFKELSPIPATALSSRVTM